MKNELISKHIHFFERMHVNPASLTVRYMSISEGFFVLFCFLEDNCVFPSVWDEILQS